MTSTGTSPARRRTIVLAVTGTLAITIHIGLGILLANSGWTIAADGVLVLVVGKVLLIVLGRHAVRRRKARRLVTSATSKPGTVTTVADRDTSVPLTPRE
jgi:hypothetical protein